MATIITTTSGISYANSAGASGPYFPLKYALPVYDPYLDTYLLSAARYPASACEPVSAVWPTGSIIYNTTSLSATYLYTVSNTKMLVSAAGQTGTTTITGNPFNATGYINLLNGKPLNPMVSGTSMTYSNGSWLVTGYTSIPVSGTLNTVSGYSNVRETYFPVVSYTPLTCAAGGQAKGLHKVRIGNQYGSFKFNKVALFMTKYDSGGVEDTSQAPVLYAIVALPNSIIKTNTGDNISYVEVDVETTISASNYFGQVSYLTNSEWNTASPGVINYTGKASLGSSAIPGSWEPRARLHLYSEDSVDHLRFSNESFDYLSFDMGSDATKAYYNIDTSATKDVEVRVRGNISASKDVIVGRNINVSGDFFNPRVSIQADGVISTDNIIYTEYLEVYNTASFDNIVRFYNNLYVHNNLTSQISTKITSAGTISAGGTDGAIYSRYLYASDYAAFNTYAYAKTLDVGKMSTFNDKMMFINGQTGLVSVQITSGGDVSAGNNLIGAGLSVVGNGIFGGSGYFGTTLQVNNNATFLRNITSQGNHYLEDGQTAEVSILMTSAGTISAGGTDGAVWTRELYSDNAVIGSPYITGNSTFAGNILASTVNVSGAFKVANGVQIDDGNLKLNHSDAAFIADARITAPSGATATTLTADCGDRCSGYVLFSGSGYGSDVKCRVLTTKALNGSLFLVTPVGNGGAINHSISVDNAELSDGFYFTVRSAYVSGNLRGFYFFIVNPL